MAIPRSTPEGQVLRYGLGFPFQVAPNRAAIFCNLRVEGVPVGDFENGTDVIVFDDLNTIPVETAIPISRNETRRDAATGQARIVVKYPVIGGFVPLGARRADGSAHPHAGTGFGVCQAISFPLNDAGYFGWDTERIHRTEVHQFNYDGEQFRSVRSHSGLEQAHPQVAGSGWAIIAPGITNAIADGDDMLQPAMAYDGMVQVSGVVRWRGAAETWEPVTFSPVTPAGESWTEASLVRDGDRGLLFSARGYGDETSNVIQVWRSGNGMVDWRLVIHASNARHEAPVSLSQAADGTPYIGANLLGSGRETLCIWTLNAERTGLEGPITARDARADFGPPPGGSRWIVDHPSGAVLRLGDGRWHGVLVYRVLESAEHKGAPPAPETGCYVEEVISAGHPVPAWRFD